MGVFTGLLLYHVAYMITFGQSPKGIKKDLLQKIKSESIPILEKKQITVSKNGQIETKIVPDTQFYLIPALKLDN